MSANISEEVLTSKRQGLSEEERKRTRENKNELRSFRTEDFTWFSATRHWLSTNWLSTKRREYETTGFRKNNSQRSSAAEREREKERAQEKRCRSTEVQREREQETQLIYG